MVGEQFDGSSDEHPAEGGKAVGRASFLGIHFACCSVYARVYVNRARTHYIGFCPRCARRVSIRIGPGGSDERFFTAY